MSNQLKPGPELDALVAEKVMGWKTNNWGDWCDDVKVIHYSGDKDWSPSTSIADAMKAVEKMRSEGWWWSIATCEAGWNVQIGRKVLDQEVAVAETAPHAICLATLTALGYPTYTKGD